jgi:hypothetical protein
MAERYLNTNEIALEELKAKELIKMKIRTKAPNFGRKSGRTGLWRENMMLKLRIIQCCHANNKQV